MKPTEPEDHTPVSLRNDPKAEESRYRGHHEKKNQGDGGRIHSTSIGHLNGWLELRSCRATDRRFSCKRLLGSGLERALQEEIYRPPYFFSTPLQVAVARLPHVRHQL